MCTIQSNQTLDALIKYVAYYHILYSGQLEIRLNVCVVVSEPYYILNDLVSVCIMLPVAFVSPGGLMMWFYYYIHWRRFVIVSSASDDYRAAAETIAQNIKQHELTGFKIVHHYDEVSLRAPDREIDTILTSIIHEARSKFNMYTMKKPRVVVEYGCPWVSRVT